MLLLVIMCSCVEATNTTNKNASSTSDNSKNGAKIKEKKNIKANWLCIPGRRVGLITSSSTEQDIIKLYGKDNVKRQSVELSEGVVAEATVVFPDTQDELVILWEETKPFQKPKEISVSKTNTQWITDQKITIGTSLETLKNINGKDFKIHGFEWEYAGLVGSWESGKINPQLKVFLDAKNPEAIYPSLLGEDLFSSANQKAQQAQLEVSTFVISL